MPFYGWHYPPFFFAVAALVAAVPYAWGLAIWLAASFAAYLAVMRAILPRPETLLVAAAFPAVFVNIGHGQNGFLTAALLGGALHLLDRRPWLAGVLIGLLAYKPQFGVLIPVALLAGGRWRTIGAAAATVAALVAVSFATLGGDVWHAFADSMTFTRTVVLEQGGTGWEKIQSIFSAVRMWGAGVPAAYAAQAALALCSAASLAWLWRSDAAFELKAAALASGSLLATPYVLDYDLVVLGGRDRVFRAPRIAPRLPRLRDQPAGRGLDRAAAVARRRRRHRHTARPAGAARDSTFSSCGAPRWIVVSCAVTRTASRKRDLNCYGVLARSSARLQCGRGFRLFLFRGPCDASASASLFSRVAGRQDDLLASRAGNLTDPALTDRTKPQKMYKLYSMQRSGNSYKVRLALALLNAPYRAIEVDILRGESRTPDFLAKNPSGQVPLLEVADGRYLAESNAILWYVAGGTSLAPESRIERAEALQWMFFEQHALEPNIGAAYFWLSLVKGGRDLQTHALEDWMERGYAALQVMENHLKTHEYFAAGQLTVADIALYGYTHVADRCDFDLATFPAIRAWLRRVEQIPGFVAMDWQPGAEVEAPGIAAERLKAARIAGITAGIAGITGNSAAILPLSGTRRRNIARGSRQITGYRG